MVGLQYVSTAACCRSDVLVYQYGSGLQYFTRSLERTNRSAVFQYVGSRAKNGQASRGARGGGRRAPGGPLEGPRRAVGGRF